MNRTLGICTLAALCCCGLAAKAWPAGMVQPRVEYAADQTISSEGRAFQSKIHHARDKQRMEMSEGGTGQIFITRLDKKVAWVLMPDQKMYTELSLDQARRSAPNDLRECSMKRTKSGTETVNGHSATRYEIEGSCPDGDSYSGTIWLTKEEIPVKMEATSRGNSGKDTRIVVELRNLRIARQDPALFEVPKGYSKLAIPVFGAPGGSTGEPAAPRRRMSAEPPAPGASAPEAGRSYTAQPRDAGATASGAQPSRAEGLRKGSAETGRSYTATGRSYTAQPREPGTSAERAVDKAIGAGRKLKSLFGW